MCSRKERSWLPTWESLWCWGWRQATDYGPISISLLFCWFIRLAVCYLVANSCSDHSLAAGAEYLVLLGGSPTPAHPWYRCFYSCAGVSSTPATCSAFAEAPISSGWGWAAQSLVWQCHTSSAAGTQGSKDVSQLSIPKEQEAFCGNASSADGTWLEHMVLSQLCGVWGWRGGRERYLSPCLL